MYTKPVKDPTLLNLFVPDINCQSMSQNTQEEFNFKLLNFNIDSSDINSTNSSLDLNSSIIDIEENSTQTTTALVVKKQYAILNPQIIFTVKKSIKLSIRSFLISLSLTFLNFFI